MNLQQRWRAMVGILGLLFFGAVLLWWKIAQTTGLLIIMFCAGFALRETLEPKRERDE